MINNIIVKRLLIVKYLFKLGVQQSMQPNTISFASVLTMHDCLDMFMNLVADIKGKETGRYLMNYFEIFPELTLQTSIGKINKRRNSLKHHAILPAKIEIDETCTITKLFLEENTKRMFEIDFNEISLSDLISFDKVREHLRKAVVYLEKGEFDESSKCMSSKQSVLSPREYFLDLS